ncbi:kinase-interacting family protein-like [Euphorbia lathyris]|uniref:kinase-interacting family protein-like n=1 Tax=Euphorbia lathyris TaxID=212925 RepID=UPI00331337B4
MADIEERIRTFLKTINPPEQQQEEEDEEAESGGGGIAVCGGGGGDTFAERAEWFFKKRPELLNLVQELYNNYISLKENSKHQRRLSSSSSSLFDNKESSMKVITPIPSSHDTRTQFGLQYFHNLTPLFDQQQEEIDTNWEIESSVSYHQTPTTTIPDTDDIVSSDTHGKTLHRTGSWSSSPYDIVSSSSTSTRSGFDEFISHLVLKNVEEEILKAQMSEIEQQNHECNTKMEILKKLIEVLESERVVLLSENSRLGEENRGLVSETVFMKRRVAQLTRCLMKMKEEHSVCMLTGKIEDLQRQIYGLEKRNKEYFDAKKKGEEEDEVLGCFQSAERLMKFKKKSVGVEVKRGRKLWEKIKKGIKFQGFISSSSSSCSTAAT